MAKKERYEERYEMIDTFLRILKEEGMDIKINDITDHGARQVELNITVKY